MRRSKGARADAAANRRLKKYSRSPAKANGGLSGEIVSNLLEAATDILIGGVVVAGGILLREIVKGASQPTVDLPTTAHGTTGMGYQVPGVNPAFQWQSQPPWYPPQQTTPPRAQPSNKPSQTKQQKRRADGGVITMRRNKEGVFVVPQTQTQNRK